MSSPKEPLIPALTMMLFLPREELVRGAAGADRRARGRSWTRLPSARSTIQDGATGADGEIPEHVREIIDFVSARTRAELEWTHGLAAPAARRRIHSSPAKRAFPTSVPGTRLA